MRDLIAEIDDRRDQDRRFRAGLHGFELQQRDGRVHGMRQGVLERMKARQRGGHR